MDLVCSFSYPKCVSAGFSRMPYYRSYRRRYARGAAVRKGIRRRPYRRRRRYRQALPMQRLTTPKLPMTSIFTSSTNRAVIPLRMKQTFTYNECRTLTWPTGPKSIDSFKYFANNPWDPNAALGGDNIWGWDQFMGPLYNNCLTYACMVEVTVEPQNSGLVGIYLSADDVELTHIDWCLNQPGAPVTMVPNLGGPPKTLKKFVRIRDWLPNASDTQLSCGPDSNTPSRVGIHVWAGSANPTGSTGTVNVLVRLTYYCLLSKPSHVQPST